MKCTKCGVSHAPYELRPYPPKDDVAYCLNCVYHLLRMNDESNIQTFHITWRHKESQRSGKGTRRLTEDQAKDLCQELNMDYPLIDHNYEPDTGSKAD